MSLCGLKITYIREGFQIGPQKEVIFPPDLSLQVIVFIIQGHCFQVSFARAQLAKQINLHLKELSITFRRNFRNMLIIGVSPSLELDFFPLLLFNRIAAFLFLDSDSWHDCITQRYSVTFSA